MINSGITRRIDDLGRIVVPKELRNNLGIRDGEPLLISTQDDAIIIKKYSKIESLEDKIKKYCQIIKDVLDIKIIITDREKVIYTDMEGLIHEKLDTSLKNLIDERESFSKEELATFFNLKGYFIVVPIITFSDSIGLVIFYSDKLDIFKYIDIAKMLSKLIVLD